MLLVAYVADTERKVTFIYLFSETMGFFFVFMANNIYLLEFAVFRTKQRMYVGIKYFFII